MNGSGYVSFEDRTRRCFALNSSGLAQWHADRCQTEMGKIVEIVEKNGMGSQIGVSFKKGQFALSFPNSVILKISIPAEGDLKVSAEYLQEPLTAFRTNEGQPTTCRELGDNVYEELPSMIQDVFELQESALDSLRANTQAQMEF